MENFPENIANIYQFPLVSLKTYEKDIVDYWDLTEKAPCFVWGTPSCKKSYSVLSDPLSLINSSTAEVALFFSARAGGWYFVDKIFNRNFTEKESAVLTTWLLKKRKEVYVPVITSYILDGVNGLYLSPPKIKVAQLLTHLYKAAGTNRKIVAFSDSEKFLLESAFIQAEAEALNVKDLINTLVYLHRKGLIVYENNEIRYDDNSFAFYEEGKVRLTESGKQFVEALKKVTNKKNNEGGFSTAPPPPRKPLKAEITVYREDGENNKEGDSTAPAEINTQVFIAMWIDKEMKIFLESLKKGIENAGYQPFMIAEHRHNEKIDDVIIKQIETSKFIIVDATHGGTGARGSVYYEAGYARGINKKVIFTCREDMIEKVHFDTRQYYHLTWDKDKLEEFSKEIEKHIKATITD